MSEPRHTGFGDCACYECWPVEADYPLATHGTPAGLLRSLWIVLRGVRFYVNAEEPNPLVDELICERTEIYGTNPGAAFPAEEPKP